MESTILNEERMSPTSDATNKMEIDETDISAQCNPFYTDHPHTDDESDTPLQIAEDAAAPLQIFDRTELPVQPFGDKSPKSPSIAPLLSMDKSEPKEDVPDFDPTVHNQGHDPTTDPDQSYYESMDTGRPTGETMSQLSKLSVESIDDREEGELEEGELEDDEEQIEKVDRESPTPLLPSPTQDQSKEKTRSTKRKHEKRKHRETEESRKKRRHEEPTQDNAPDFDSLLKEELYLVAGGATPEAYPNDEEEQEGPHAKGDDGADSASGDDQERRRRSRRTRKRSGSTSPGSRKNEAVCMFFLQGGCQSGSSCPYSHEITKCGRKMELCKFYMMDCCAKKEKCLYMHKDFPCKYYHYGMKCKAGESCKFSHNSLQEPTKNILLKHIELAPKDILGDFPRLTKHVALLILNVTLDKRKGEEPDDSALENTREMEGLGFKYLDRALRSWRKRTGVPKVDRETVDNKLKENDKEREERSPKKSRRLNDNEERKEHDKDKPRDRDKDRDRYRDRPHRDRKDRFRDRPHRDHKRDKDHDGHSRRHGSKSREVFQRIEENNPTSGVSVRTPQKDSRDTGTVSWYSSDDDNDSNKLVMKSGRVLDAGTPPESQPTEGAAADPEILKGFDVNYIKNLLLTVENAESQPLVIPEATPAPEPRTPVVARSSYQQQYDDIGNDLKGVFDTVSEPSRPAPAPHQPRSLTQDLANLIQTVRLKTGNVQPEDSFRGTEEVSTQGHLSAPRARPVRSDSSESFNRDPRVRESAWGRSDSVDQRFHSETVDTDLRYAMNHTLADPQSPPRQPPNTVDTDLRTGIYDVDLRDLRMISPTPRDLEPHAFGAPESRTDLEIEGRPGFGFEYKLVEVTIPKPDFTRLIIQLNNDKNLDDPRIRKMFNKKPAEVSNSGLDPDFMNTADPNDIAHNGPLSAALLPNPVASRDPRRRDVSALPFPPHSDQRPRLDQRNQRLDPRTMARNGDGLMDPNNIRPYMGRMSDANYMPNGPCVPPGQFPQPLIDPRGRPGLLGPAPMGHKVGGGQYFMAAPGSFSRDRNDYGPPPVGRPFQKPQMWNEPPQTRVNDPRIKRDMSSSFGPN